MTNFEYKDATINEPEHEPQLCVQGFPNDYESGLKIDVSQAWDLNSLYYNNDKAIKNAIVKLYENGVFINEFKPYTHEDIRPVYPFPNYFIQNFEFKQGKEYQIDVTAEGYQGVKGKTTIPIAIKPDSLTAKESIRDDKEGILFTLYFTDPVDVKNYYLIVGRSTEVRVNSNVGRTGDTTFFENVRIPLDDPIFDLLPNNQSFVAEPMDISSKKPRMFDDETIRGKQYALNFFLEKNTWSDTNERYISEIEVFLMSISKEMYEGLKSNYLFQVMRSDLYAQKISIYSNMSNGIGLWGGYSSASTSVKLKKRINFKPYQ